MIVGHTATGRVVRIRRRCVPLRGEPSWLFSSDLGLLLAAPVTAVGWLVWKLWFRGAYNVAVIEIRDGRDQIVHRETALTKGDADRQAIDLERRFTIAHVNV